MPSSGFFDAHIKAIRLSSSTDKFLISAEEQLYTCTEGSLVILNSKIFIINSK